MNNHRDYFTNSSLTGGQILVDRNERGKFYPWKVYKKSSIILSSAMSLRDDFFSNFAIQQVENCSSYLGFLECRKYKYHPKILVQANFCKNRLCVGCQMRRSLKCYATTIKIMHWILKENPDMEFVFLTLTVPNVSLENLGQTVDHLFKSWSKLTKRRGVYKIMQGYLRALEITYNHKIDTYHPHFHALIAVKESYFKSKDYIKRDKWLELWQESTNQPEITQVDIRKIKSSNPNGELSDDDLAKACAEIAKYSTKTWSTASKNSNRKFFGKQMELDFGVEGHLWIRETAQETADTIVELGAALKGRRLLQYGGIMRDAKKLLKLQDGEDANADLVNTKEEQNGCKCPVCSGDTKETIYLWDKSVNNYYSYISSVDF